jgi:hypothetical protein
LVWRHKATELEDTKDLVLLSTAIQKTTIPSAIASNTRLAYEVLVRPSDTDRTRTVTGSRVVQFFEDAVAGSKVPDVLYVEFLHGLKAKTRCDVVCVPNNENGGQEMIGFIIERDSKQSFARAYISWANKTIRDEPPS